ncbi:hypothetical protein Tco_0511712 [Tanacetum coccineum]
MAKQAELNNMMTVLTRTRKIPVNTARASVLLGENGKLLLRPQQVVVGDPKDMVGTKSLNTMVDQILEIDYPHGALKNKGIVDSGCSRHMTRNKAYLVEYQDYNGGPSCLGFRELLERDIDGTKDLLLPDLLILWLTKVSTDCAKLVPLGKDSTAIKPLKKILPRTFLREAPFTMLSLYITAKVAGKPVSISEPSIRRDLLFDDADGIDSLPNQAIFDAIQLMGIKFPLILPHFLGNITPLFDSMLVQPTEDEGDTLERQSEPQPIPSPPHLSEDQHETQTDPSPRPSPTTHIPDLFLEIDGKEILKETVDAKGVYDTKTNMETEDAQDVVREHAMVLQTEYSTNKLDEDDQNEGRSATQTAPTTTTLTIFGDDETIAQPLPKIDPKDKGKKMIEEEDKSDTDLEDMTEAEKKFKHLARDEEVAKKVQEDWEEEEEVKKLAKEEATKLALSKI